MHKVTKAFDFYHDGINATHYAVGECELPADAAAVAEAEGWAEQADKQKPANAYFAKHRGAGKWDILDKSEQIVASGLSGDEAKVKAAELNEASEGK